MIKAMSWSWNKEIMQHLDASAIMTVSGIIPRAFLEPNISQQRMKERLHKPRDWHTFKPIIATPGLAFQRCPTTPTFYNGTLEGTKSRIGLLLIQLCQAILVMRNSGGIIYYL